MGIYGNNENKNRIAGKKAMKKEKAIPDARVVIAPFTILFQKKIITL
jgi:hypothetical protein